MSISRGFEASYNVVSKALKGRAERQLQERLAQESERYGVTEGAYGQGLGENVQQVQGLQQQALEQARYQGASEEDLARIESQYAPSIAELQRRQGLTAPDYTVASRSMRPEDTFATREEAEMAAKPMRTQGLARVYRDAGEIDKADELLERAEQQELRGIQRQAAELNLKGAQRTEKQAEAFGVATQRIADARAAGQIVDSQFLRTIAADTGANFNSLLDSAAKELGFEDSQGAAAIKKLKANLAKAAGGGVDGLNTFLSENFDPDKTDKTLPKVVKDKQGNFVVMYGDKVIPSYGAHKSLDYLVGTVQGMIEYDPLSALKSIASIRLTEAQTRKAQAEAGAVGLEKKPRAPTIAELNTIAKGMIDSGMEDPDAPGTPLKYTTALAMARAEAAGVPYVSEADRATAAAIAARQEEERKKKEGGGATTTTTTTPARGLFTDPQGRTQLLQPFSDLNSWRRRLVQEQNAASEAGGLTGGF